jgi:hypothetical protein
MLSQQAAAAPHSTGHPLLQASRITAAVPNCDGCHCCAAVHVQHELLMRRLANKEPLQLWLWHATALLTVKYNGAAALQVSG